MANADLGVRPKRDDSFGGEAFSTKILEFMALGVPVLVASTRIDRYYFKEDLLRFFKSSDADALAVAMVDAYQNRAVGTARAANALAFIEHNNWSDEEAKTTSTSSTISSGHLSEALLPARGSGDMRLDRHITNMLAARGVRSAGASAIPILMYHGVHEQCDVARSPYYRTVTSPARFDRHMKLLRERGYRTLQLGELLKCLEVGDTDVPPPVFGLGKAVVITFDDALESFATHAYPILERDHYTATVFIPSAYIGRSFVTGEPCMSNGQLRELTRVGVEFGSHTANHPKLYGADAQTIRRELRQSRKDISEAIDLDVDLFSYPFAFPSHDRGFVRLLEQELEAAGYRGGTTTSIGRASARSPRQSRPSSHPVNDCDDDRLFMGKIDGHYDWLATAQGAFRHAKHWKSWLGGRGY